MMTEHQITVLLKKKYCAPEYALFPQVRNGTGYSRATTRTADAVALSLYPSRGIHLHGFEIKVTKSDWQRELKEPDKAESICAFCDFWWVVAPAGIANDLPPNWGLIEADGNKLKVMTKAPKLTPRPLDLFFIASLCRAAQECLLPDAELKAARQQGYDEGYLAGKDAGARAGEHFKQQYQDLFSKVHKFETDLGHSIGDAWRGNSVGKTLRFLLDGGFAPLAMKLANLENQALRIAADVKEIMQENQEAVQS